MRTWARAGRRGEPAQRAGFKTLSTEAGPVRIAVPRDRDGSFDPVLVPKQARRSGAWRDTRQVPN